MSTKFYLEDSVEHIGVANHTGSWTLTGPKAPDGENTPLNLQEASIMLYEAWEDGNINPEKLLNLKWDTKDNEGMEIELSFFNAVFYNSPLVYIVEKYNNEKAWKFVLMVLELALSQGEDGYEFYSLVRGWKGVVNGKPVPQGKQLSEKLYIGLCRKTENRTKPTNRTAFQTAPHGCGAVRFCMCENRPIVGAVRFVTP